VTEIPLETHGSPIDSLQVALYREIHEDGKPIRAYIAGVYSNTRSMVSVDSPEKLREFALQALRRAVEWEIANGA
jgi:hypothetical protein